MKQWAKNNWNIQAMFHSSDSGHDSSESDTLMTIIQTMIQYKQHTIMIQYKLFFTL